MSKVIQTPTNFDIEKIDKEFAKSQQNFLYLFFDFEKLYNRLTDFQKSEKSDIKPLDDFYNNIIDLKNKLKVSYEELISLSFNVNSLLAGYDKSKKKKQNNDDGVFAKLLQISQNLQQFLEISKQKCDFSRKAIRKVSEFYESYQAKYKNS